MRGSILREVYFLDSSIIEGNRIIKLTMNTNSSPKFGGGIVIYGNAGTLSIINNFIAPIYENLGTNNNNNIYGIVFGSATWVGTAHIYHNTIVIPQSSATPSPCLHWMGS